MDVGAETAKSGDMNTEEGQTSLQQLLDRGFGGDTFMLALALGREEDQINSMLAGTEDIDEDLEMKINGIAQERGIELDQTP